MKLSGLPPPTTFAEGMRLLFALAALVAGISFGIGAIALVSVLVWGGWPPALYGQIVSILGIVAIGALALIGITQIGILLGGPVGRFKVSVDKTGVSGEASGTGEPMVPASAVAAAASGAATGAVVASQPPAEPKP